MESRPDNCARIRLILVVEVLSRDEINICRLCIVYAVFIPLGVNSGFDIPTCCISRRGPPGGLTGCDGPSPGVDRAKLESRKMCVRLTQFNTIQWQRVAVG
jgi:hypothetical protein